MHLTLRSPGRDASIHIHSAPTMPSQANITPGTRLITVIYSHGPRFIFPMTPSTIVSKFVAVPDLAQPGEDADIDLHLRAEGRVLAGAQTREELVVVRQVLAVGTAIS